MTKVGDIYPSDRVILREVGLRDGLQLVKKFGDLLIAFLANIEKLIKRPDQPLAHLALVIHTE